jgi:DNA-directed RNA polymerase subunit RPC12/RpoP
MSQAERENEPMRCPKCGFTNGPGIKFCGNCGAELRATMTTDYVEALAVLHIASSLYVLVTLGSNYLVQRNLFLLIPYAVVGTAGLYVGYQFHRGNGGRWLKVASAITSMIGLVVTSFLYVFGLLYGGLFGPSWVLFLVCLWLLWVSRRSF